MFPIHLPVWLSICLPVLIVLGVLLVLWQLGALTVGTNRALWRVGTGRGKNWRSASVGSCTSRTVQLLPPRTGGAYRFALQCALTKGRVWVQLADRSRQVLAELSADGQQAAVELDPRQRYRLTICCEGATGTYRIEWQRIGPEA